MRPVATLALALPVVAALALGGCMSSGDRDAPTSADQDPGDLKGRAFVATAITQGGSPRAIVPDTRIEVTFAMEERQELWWDSGCNSAWSDLEIKADDLRIDDRFGTTLMGCNGPVEVQETWLTRFLLSDPEWRLTGDRLTLSSGKTAIELQETGA